MSDSASPSTYDLLLVTRNYPPMVGGLERYAYDLHRTLSVRMRVALLANRVGLRGVPLFVLRVLWHVARHRDRYARVHVADAALAPLGWLLRCLTGVPVTVTTHALDVTYANALYQRVVPWCLRRLDGVVCVSRFTRDQCVARGVDANRCHVIPNGIRREALAGSAAAPDGPAVLRELEGKRVLVTIGRLVKRKGVAWFVAEVLPGLGPEFIYLVGGAGEQRAAIEQAIAARGLGSRVRLLGVLDEQGKRALLERAELFVMPNVAVAGDAEGFGISVIEATAHGVPVIASDLEGLRDAVVDGVTGRLVASGDVDAWRRVVQTARFDRAEVARQTLARYDWDRLVERYLDFFKSTMPEGPRP